MFGGDGKLLWFSVECMTAASFEGVELIGSLVGYDRFKGLCEGAASCDISIVVVIDIQGVRRDSRSDKSSATAILFHVTTVNVALGCCEVVSQSDERRDIPKWVKTRFAPPT